MKKNIIFLLLFFITAFFAFNIKARAAEYQYCEYQLFDDEYNDVENSYHECPAKGLVWMPFLGPVGLVAKEIACLNNYKLLDSSFIGFKLSVVNVSGYALPLIDDTKSASLAYPGINNLSSDKFYDSDKFKCADNIYINKEGADSSTVKLNVSHSSGEILTPGSHYSLRLISDKDNIPSKEFSGLNGHTDIDIGGVTDCEGILGDFKTDLEEILKIIRIIGPLLVVIYSTYDYLSAVLKKDDDALKKANGKLVKRLILVAILFFLPIILDLILGFIDEKYTTCIK